MKKNSEINRRDFFKKASLTTASLAGLPILARASNSLKINEFPKEQIIVFQGDSITDAGRNRSRYYANDAGGLGYGYVFQIVAELLGSNPSKDLKCYNRGISGNKVYQLADRWEDDCLNLKPDVLSILIGVNDFWHKLNGNYDGTPDIYNTDLRKLLDRTKKEYPSIKLILGEPFAVKGGSAITQKWESEFYAYQDQAKKIAEDYNAVFIPLQKIFDDALKIAPVSYWCPDGVHPSIAGAYLMKNGWLEAFSQLYD